MGLSEDPTTSKHYYMVPLVDHAMEVQITKTVGVYIIFNGPG
jgi:hypothetical protein